MVGRDDVDGAIAVAQPALAPRCAVAIMRRRAAFYLEGCEAMVGWRRCRDTLVVLAGDRPPIEDIAIVDGDPAPGVPLLEAMDDRLRAAGFPLRPDAAPSAPPTSRVTHLRG